MTLEQLQDTLLPILFDDNDKFEDVNRANILYDRELDNITIKRTKFDKTRCPEPDFETWKSILDVLKITHNQISYKCNKDKNHSRLILRIYKVSSIMRTLITPSDILLKFKKVQTEIHKSLDDNELNLDIISEETEKVFLKFQELLETDITNYTGIPY